MMSRRRQPGGQVPSDTPFDKSASTSPDKASSSTSTSQRSSRAGSLSKARARVAEGLKSPLLAGMKLDEIREGFNKGVEDFSKGVEVKYVVRTQRV